MLVCQNFARILYSFNSLLTDRLTYRETDTASYRDASRTKIQTIKTTHQTPKNVPYHFQHFRVAVFKVSTMEDVSGNFSTWEVEKEVCSQTTVNLAAFLNAIEQVPRGYRGSDITRCIIVYDVMRCDITYCTIVFYVIS